MRKFKQGQALAQRHSGLVLVGVFGLVWAGATVIYFWRFPNNLLYPNFYAEDGSILARNILAHGWGQALMTTFNGYYIWGLYLLEGAGFALNSLIYHGQLVDLPKSFALISYGFLGFTAALPVLLLRPYINLAWRVVAGIAIAFVPLPTTDYAVIGTIGNLKFLFVPIALMLLLYRIALPRSSRRIILADVGLMLCVYTNVTVYALLPAILLADGLRPRQLWHMRGVLRRNNVALWSAVGLGLAVCYQLYVVATQGIPPTPGYLDTPIQPGALVEVGVARSYLFPLIYWCYKSFNNITIIGSALVLTGLVVYFGRQANRRAYALMALAIALMTGLFVATRPGVTALYKGYFGSGPDQFFYGQNIVFLLAIVLLAADGLRRLRPAWRPFAPMLLAGLLLVPTAQAGSYGARDFMQHDIGTIKANAQKACAREGASVTLPLYPVAGFNLSAPRSQVCTAEVEQYRPDEVSLGLTPAGSQLVVLNSEAARQTFVSPRDDLSGLSVYLGTYNRTHISGYRLELYDGGCHNLIRSAELPHRVSDNSFADVRFAAVEHSAGRHYCFGIHAAGIAPASPLAARLSAAGSYPTGHLTLNGRGDPRSLVFGILYPNQN
ncbi:MAG: hypothetical protein JWN01_88 [Patescibacteria group bacterium]|nr:hypothetical protein [Patescibacteria group bacterium]